MSAAQQTELLLRQREIKVKSDVYIGSHVIVGKRPERVDALQCPLRGIVHGRVAAALRDANIGNRTVRVDAERHHCVSPARGPNRRLDGALIPRLLNPGSDGVYVPRIATAEIAAALALDRGTRRRSRRLRKSRGTIRSAAMAGNGIICLNGLVFQSSCLAGRRQWFFLFKLGDFRGVGLWLGR